MRIFFLRKNLDQNISVRQFEQIDSRSLELSIGEAWEPGDFLHASMKRIPDFFGQYLDTVVRIRWPPLPKAGEIVINEILFDPGDFSYQGLHGQQGHEFFEIANFINDTFDLQDIGISILGKKQGLGTGLLLPKQIIAFTEDTSATWQQFGTFLNQNLYQINFEKSLKNDGGNLQLFRQKDSFIIDEVNYNTAMHYELLIDTKGVSLERKRLDWPSSNINNWTSASAYANFGTPGYVNSQKISFFSAVSEVNFSNQQKILAHNNGKFLDHLNMEILFQKSGFLLSSAIYDIFGREIKNLANNKYCAQVEILSWNGIARSGLPAPVGNYIWLLEVYHPDGEKWVKKYRITLL